MGVLGCLLFCSCKFGTEEINIGLDVHHDGVTPAAGGAPCSDLWGPPVPLTELNTAETDCGGQISPDGLVYYFDSKLTGVWDLFVARRTSNGSAFGSATPIAELNTGSAEADPTTTPDELELYFTSDRGGANCIHRAVRPSSTSTWEPPSRLDALCDTAAVGPYISADGLTLYYTRSEHPTSLGTVMVTSRVTRDDTFSPGAPIPVLTLRDIAFGYPALSPDGLTIYVSATTTELDLWKATRPDLGAEFDSPAPIDELNSSALDGDPSVTADGSQLFFASGRGGSMDMYVSTRMCP